MPLPKPKDNESKDDFMNRCMGNKTMNDEYSDNDQRFAVCQSLWDQEKKSMEKERRFIQTELRVKEPEKDGEMPVIAGYAAVFNKLSENLGGFKEKIAPGAFAKALKNSDVRALWNHDPNFVLGRLSSNTLKLEERKKGLYMEVTPPDTQWARDLLVSIGRKDVTQQSFAFTVGKEEWDEKKDETTRTILEVEQVFDVSPVTYPAYPDTSVALRSWAEWKESNGDTKEKRDQATDNDPLSITINLNQENIDEIVSRVLTAIKEPKESKDLEDIGEDRELDEESEERENPDESSPQDEVNPPDAEERISTPFRKFFQL